MNFSLFAQGTKTDTTYYPNTKTIKSIFTITGSTKHSWLFYENSKLKQESTQVNDTLQGIWKSWYNSGTLSAECSYVKGLLDGAYKTFYENGSMRDYFNYSINKEEGKLKSVLNGTQKTYFADGKLQKQTGYKNDKKDGTETEWYSDGTKKTEINYKDGFKHGASEVWYESSKPANKGRYDTIQKSNYKNISSVVEVRTGHWQTWFPSGKNQSDGKFLKGKQTGKHTEWYENGNKKSEIEYEDGNVNGAQKRWFQNGQLQISQTVYSKWDSIKKFYPFYNEGKIEEYDESGNPVKIGAYKNGKKTGKWLVYYKGVLNEEAEYTHGLLLNKHTTYYSNKIISKTEFYKEFKINGKDSTLLDGELTEYYDNGAIRTRTPYRKGVVVSPGVKIYYKNGNLQQELVEDGNHIIKNEYHENETKQKESVALKDSSQQITNLKYFLLKTYDSKGQLRKQISSSRNYTADWSEEGVLIGEGFMFNYQGDYPITGYLNYSWNALYYNNGEPYKEMYMRQNMSVGYEIEWYITGQLKRIIQNGSFDIQWLQDGEVMVATFFKPRTYNQVLDTVMSKEWLQNMYKKYNHPKNKMLRINHVKDGIAQSYFDDKQVHFETYIANNAFDSIFRGYYPDGKLLVEWHLRNNIPHGKYTLMNSDGALYESGYFTNGKPSGVWIINDLFGAHYQEFEYDTLDAKSKNFLYKKEFYSYKEGGALKSLSTYKNGKLNGIQKTWSKTGELSLQFESRNDTTIGIYQSWWENGKVSRTAKYNNKGKKQGIEEAWYENGNKNYEQTYLDDKKTGLTQAWWKNGTPRYNGYYKNDLKDSIWVVYDSTGVLVSEEMYSNGIIQYKPSSLPCHCIQPTNNIQFAQPLTSIMDTSYFTKWQFAYHEKLSGDYLNHLYFMHWQNSYSKNSTFNNFSLVSYKSIEIGFPNKDGVKLVLNPCSNKSASLIQMTASLVNNDPDRTYLEIKPYKLAFKFDTKLLKPINTELEECLAFFKINFMNYDSKGITLHEAKFDCFPPSQIGNTSISIELSGFTPLINSTVNHINKDINPYYDSKEDEYNIFLKQQLIGNFTGMTEGEGTINFSYLDNKSLQLPFKKLVANNNFVALTILFEKVITTGTKISFTNSAGLINISEEELKNYFKKKGFSIVITYMNASTSTLTLKLIYKK